MADNTLQFGITVDTSPVASNLSDIQSQFQQTASTVASQWTEASSTITASLGKMADGAEEAAGRTQEQIEKASGAVGLLSDIIGIKVPESLQKMLASSEVVGPALEAAFAPLAIISLIQLIGDAIKKVGDLTNSWRNLSEAERAAISTEVNEEKKAEASARRIEEIHRETLLVGKTAEQQAQMRAQWAKDDAASAAQKLKTSREQLAQDRLVLTLVGQVRREFQSTGDDGLVEIPLVSDEQIKKAQADMAFLEGLYGKDLHDLDRETQESAEKRSLADAQAAEASVQAAKASAQARAQAARAAAQQYMQGLQEELIALRQNHRVSLTEELYFWKAAEGAAAAYPDVYRQIMKRVGDINKQLVDVRAADLNAYLKESQQQEERYSNENIQIAKRANDAIVKSGKEQLDAQAALYKGDMDAAKVDEQTKVQLAEAALARGKITKQQEIAIVAAAKQQEIQLEIQSEKAIEALYDNEAKKVAEIEAKIRQLRAQAALAEAAAANQQAKANESRWQKQLQDWQNISKEMQDSYLQMLNNMNSALVNFVTTGKFNWQQMANSMIGDILKIALQWVESQIMMKVMGASTAKTNATAGIGASAAQGAAAAGASVAAIPVIGWSMVEAVSSSTYAMLEAYQAGIAGFALGGIVPATGLAIVHQGETILPASMSGTGAGLKGGGSPVHVHFHVNAIDGADAAAFIQKNANNIASVLYKQMRKKGIQVG